jgi:hypothetical protein
MSSSRSETTTGKAAAANPPAGKTTTKKTKKVRLTQEQIDSYIRYQTVHMPEDALPRVTEERLALAKLKDHSHLDIPMDQIDDYVAKILRDINRMEAKFMKKRDRILNDYYTKGYAEEEVTDDEKEEGSGAPAPQPAPGRRRFRPGVTKQAGQTKKL